MYAVSPSVILRSKASKVSVRALALPPVTDASVPRAVYVNCFAPSVSRRLRASKVAVVAPALVRLPAASHS